MIKRVSLVFKKPGLSDEEFSKYWREVHGPLAAKTIPGLRKYVQNRIIRSPENKYPSEYDIDGIAELWFDDLEAFNKFLAWMQSSDPIAKELIADGNRVVDERMVRYNAEEYVQL